MMWLGIKSYFACAWSACTYLFGGMPADKLDYFSHDCGFSDLTNADYAESVTAYKTEPSFHRLKDIGVEWTDAWPQRAFKLAALFGCCLFLTGLITGLSVLVLLL